EQRLPTSRPYGAGQDRMSFSVTRHRINVDKRFGFFSRYLYGRSGSRVTKTEPKVTHVPGEASSYCENEKNIVARALTGYVPVGAAGRIRNTVGADEEVVGWIVDNSAGIAEGPRILVWHRILRGETFGRVPRL